MVAGRIRNVSRVFLPNLSQVLLDIKLHMARLYLRAQSNGNRKQAARFAENFSGFCERQVRSQRSVD